MNQIGLFDICAKRHKGNENSVKAHKKSLGKAEENRRMILAYLEECGANGATCEEMEHALKLSHQSLSPRCTELKAKNQVQVVGKRPTRTGSPAAVLRLVKG